MSLHVLCVYVCVYVCVCVFEDNLSRLWLYSWCNSLNTVLAHKSIVSGFSAYTGLDLQPNSKSKGSHIRFFHLLLVIRRLPIST